MNTSSVEISNSDIYSLILSGSVGFIAGFATGYAVKKILKLVLLVVGFLLAALLYLNHVGVIVINWDKLQQWLMDMFNALRGMFGVYQSLAVSVPLAGFSAGFLLGLRYG